MSAFGEAVYVETLKARRSRISLLTALGFTLLPLTAGFFMVILRDPELARRVGLISAKAHILAGAADWPTYLGLLAQSVAGGGIVLFGFIASWVFGREYSDRTAKDLLALPTSRSLIVLSKFVVVAAWSAGLTVMICLVGLLVGEAVGLPRVPSQVVLEGTGTIALVAILVIALLTPIAFFAGVGHGYLAPIGFMFLVLFMAQVISALGWGGYFPWSVPILYTQGQALGIISYVIVGLTSLAGLAGTLLWWEWADQSR